METTKKILDSRHLAPSKKRGQNFLVNPQTPIKMLELAGFTGTDTVIELGVGLGALTLPLAARVKRVIGLEVDTGIIRYHREEGTLPENVTLLDQDLLTADYRDLATQSGGRLKIIANLPYSITNPLLFRLLEFRDIMDSAVLMLQKEVGERLCASVGTKEYGVLSVLLAAGATVRTLMRLGPGQFHPRPKVDSVVVAITFFPVPERIAQLPPYDPALLHRVVKASFGQRRKTLHNALAASPLLGLSKEQVAKVLQSAGLAPSRRAETLSLEEYVTLTRVVAAAL